MMQADAIPGDHPRVSPWTAAIMGMVLCVVLTGGCGGSSDVKKRRTRGIQKTPPANLKDVGKPSPEVTGIEPAVSEPKATRSGQRPKRRVRVVELPKPDEFTERDFIESNQESRDPFRNFIQVQEDKEKKGAVIVDTSVVFLKEYALSELRVTGIVGRGRRYAMVLDPRSGRTTILKTRDVIGKERALIFQIARDHLVLLVPRVRPGKAEPYERKKMYVDETRKIVDIGSDRLRPDESGIRYTHRRGRRAPSRAKEP